MLRINWSLYATLTVAAVLGSIAILPYALAIAGNQLSATSLSTSQIALASIVQGTILFAIVTLVGMLAANQVGLTLISHSNSYLPALLLGLLAGIIIVALELLVFGRFVPQTMQEISSSISPWKQIVAIFYAAVNEEILLRLFLLSGLVWLLNFVAPIASFGDIGSYPYVWLAIIVTAILFGVGHLPATAAMASLTPGLITRAIVLNGIPGLIFGYIYWQNGLTAAMAAHLATDVILRGYGILNG